MTLSKQPPDDMPRRSAEHWFLDAATYVRDGDHKQAIAAAQAGIAALLETERDET